METDARKQNGQVDFHLLQNVEILNLRRFEEHDSHEFDY